MIGLTLALVLAGSFSAAGGKTDPVKVQASAGKSSGDKQVVLVELKIDKGWHIYANPVDLEELVPAETIVKVKAGGKAVPAKIDYPAGKPRTEKGVGTFKIYEGKVVIPVELTKTDAAVEVSVRFQACDESRCLQPKTVKLNVK
jgi:DsbC/DsbD-like thiol-disulfide interchange protein